MAKTIKLQPEETEPKVNAYTCSCGKNTVIKHRDLGVTPMFIDCIHCGERAISHMYKVPQDLDHDLVAFKPQNTAEWSQYALYLKKWYKSNNSYTKQMLKQAIKATKSHVNRGGVIMLPADQMII